MTVPDNGTPKIRVALEVVALKQKADKSIEVTFSMSEDCIIQMAQLAECKRQDIPLLGEFSAFGGGPLNNSAAAKFRKLVSDE